MKILEKEGDLKKGCEGVKGCERLKSELGVAKNKLWKWGIVYWDHYGSKNNRTGMLFYNSCIQGK